MDAPVEVRRQVVLPVEPEEAWEALTDPEELEAWLADDVELEAEPGADAVFRWDDGAERHGVVEVAEPAERLALRWSEGDGAETLVEFRLEPAEQGTLLTVIETRPSALAPGLRWGPRLSALAAHAGALARV